MTSNVHERMLTALLYVLNSFLTIATRKFVFKRVKGSVIRMKKR